MASCIDTAAALVNAPMTVVNFTPWKRTSMRITTSCPRFAALATMLAFLGACARAEDTFVYFGSHAQGPKIGFSVAHFDTDTGRLTQPVFLQEAVQPAFFIIGPDGKHLYTSNSSVDGALCAYAIDPATAGLTLLNSKPTGGGDPSYVSLDATGHYLMTANYGGGSIAVFALLPDGSIGERTAFVQHTGSSVNPDRQTRPHAHSIRVDPTNRFVLVPDLGVDKLFVYRLDPKTGALQPNDPPFASVAPGAGPRHTTLHPNGKYVYLINEMASSIIRFGWDSNRGVLTPFETVSTLPPDFQGTSTCAEILMYPSGKFLYATNRGHDSVAVFAVEAGTGRLTPIQDVSTRGKTPRNCDFDPTFKWLLVTNQDSSNAVVFRIDPNTGHLTPTGDPVAVPSPFCERFLPIRK